MTIIQDKVTTDSLLWQCNEPVWYDNLRWLWYENVIWQHDNIWWDGQCDMIIWDDYGMKMWFGSMIIYDVMKICNDEKWYFRVTLW